MHNTILAAAASNPFSNWTSQWKAGWDNAPATGSAHATSMGWIVVVLLIAVVVVGFRRLRSSS